MIITNIYIPPTSSGSPLAEVLPNIETILVTSSHKNHLILSDLNALDDLWFSNIQCSRGSAIAELVEDSDLVPINEVTNTRARNGTLMSPDVSLASPDLVNKTTWSTLEQAQIIYQSPSKSGSQRKSCYLIVSQTGTSETSPKQTGNCSRI